MTSENNNNSNFNTTQNGNLTTLNEEILEPNAKNIILSIISQLGKGSDLQRISLPTFVLEPRSFLEKITDFMAHPNYLLDVAKKADDGSDQDKNSSFNRFLGIVKYFLSGWHVKPIKGVKKPYNPVLGEFFRCWFKYDNNTKGYYVAEQVSHHPPKSSYLFVSPDNKFIIQGTMYPKSKFYGTSAGTVLEGQAKITLLNHNNETYNITYPNIYVYGILFGQLEYDLGDFATITNKENNLTCKLEFKTKVLHIIDRDSLEEHIILSAEKLNLTIVKHCVRYMEDGLTK